MIELSPCKINIGLEITSKRPDGYHNIESIFYPVPLYDIIELCKSTDSNFLLTESGIKVDCEIESNLLYKTWKLMNNLYNVGGVKVHIHKQIPTGAGLGGGSANASTLLKLINKEFQLELSDNKLIKLASQLGADCPFFIKNKAVFAYNTGTDFEELDINLSNYYIAIIKTPVSISTKEAYSGIKPQHSSYNMKEEIFSKIGNWEEKLINKFEKPNFAHFPFLENVKKYLKNKGALYVSMTGSGSAIYGIFQTPPLNLKYEANSFIWWGKLK